MALVTAVRDIGRLREIYSVLAHHGFGQFAQRLGWGGPRNDAAPKPKTSIPVAALDKMRREFSYW